VVRTVGFLHVQVRFKSSPSLYDYETRDQMRAYDYRNVTGRAVMKRAAHEEDGKHAKLMAMIGVEYLDWIEHFFKADKLIAYYIFARLFEQSHLSGGSGVHVFIIDLTVDKTNLTEIYNKQVYPVSATLSISLDEYDKMREAPRVWRTIGKVKEPFDYPDYERF